MSQTGQQSDSPAEPSLEPTDGSESELDDRPTPRPSTAQRRSNAARSNRFRTRRRDRFRTQREERTALQRGDEPEIEQPPAVAGTQLVEPEAAETPAATEGRAAAVEAVETQAVETRPSAKGAAAPAPADQSGGRGTFRSLKIRNYRLFFTGNVICQTGTWMNRVAQDWLVLQLTDNNPIALGIATALQFGPTLLLSIWAGTLADRSDKRKLLAWIQVVLGLAAVTLGILTWTGVAQIWHVFAACLVVGTAASLDGPVRQAFVGELVGPAQITNAVALNAMGFNGARIVGPAIAGVLISLVDTGPVMTVSGLSYIAVIVGLIRIDPAQLRRSKPVARKKGQMREGLAYVRHRPDLILVLSLLFMVATFGMNFQVTLAIMARIVFERDAASYGLLSTAIAVGALLGATLSARRVHAPRQRLLIGTALGFGLLQVVLGLVGSYYLLAVLLIPEGMLMLAFSNAANAMVQMTTAPSMRGRVMGIYTLAFLGGTPFFSPVLGVLADRFGGGAPLVFGGAVSALSAVVLGIWLLRSSPVRFQVRVSPVPHLHLQNPDVEEGDDEHFSETVAQSLQRIGGGARRTVRPAVRVVRRAGRVVRRPGRH